MKQTIKTTANPFKLRIHLRKVCQVDEGVFKVLRLKTELFHDKTRESTTVETGAVFDWILGSSGMIECSIMMIITRSKCNMNKVLEHGVIFHYYLKFHTYIYSKYIYAIFRRQN